MMLKNFCMHLISTLYIKKWLPKTFLKRALLIVVVPIVVIQVISSYIFFERHWEEITWSVSESMAYRLRGGIYFLNASPLPLDEKVLLLKNKWGIQAKKVKALPAVPKGHHLFQSRFERALRRLLPAVHVLQMKKSTTFFWVVTEEGVICFSFPTKWILSRTSLIWLVWSLGSALLFAVLSVIFMRKQIAPLKNLALMAKAFSSGKQPLTYYPKGAEEIREVGSILNQIYNKLVMQNKEREHFLMGVSHDMRTPLARMRLAVSLIDSQDHVLSTLKQDINQMNEMIDSYLAFIQTGYLEAPETCSVFNKVMAVTKRYAQNQEKKIILHVPRGLILHISPKAFERCLDNVIDNALRYAKYNVRVSVLSDGSVVRCDVEDDGKGVPPLMLSHIFQPFVRLESERMLERSHTGLGLSIVKQLMEYMGGFVSAERSALGGLKVSLYFQNNQAQKVA